MIGGVELPGVGLAGGDFDDWAVDGLDYDSGGSGELRDGDGFDVMGKGAAVVSVAVVFVFAGEYDDDDGVDAAAVVLQFLSLNLSPFSMYYVMIYDRLMRLLASFLICYCY